MTQRIIPVQVQQSDSGPVQSRSFRVLQKITDTDSSNDVDTEQMRKLQLSEDDRILMNKFKEQSKDLVLSLSVLFPSSISYVLFSFFRL